MRLTEAGRASIAAKAKARWADPEFAAKARASMSGIRWTDERRAAKSVAMKGVGHPQTEEAKAKLRAAHTGKKLSPEHCAKLGATRRGKPGPWAGKKRGEMSPEWRAKIGAANLGRSAYFPKRRFYYRDVPFRSSWEERVARAFDALGIEWQYESRRFSLTENSTYCPDFWLPQHRVFWEVKGYYGPKSRVTVEGFRAKYPDIPLILATGPVIEALEASVPPH
jgi:hypothetical protein